MILMIPQWIREVNKAVAFVENLINQDLKTQIGYSANLKKSIVYQIWKTSSELLATPLLAILLIR